MKRKTGWRDTGEAVRQVTHTHSCHLPLNSARTAQRKWARRAERDLLSMRGEIATGVRTVPVPAVEEASGRGGGDLRVFFVR